LLRVNRYVVIFIAVIAVSFLIVGSVVQSDYFGSFISKEIQKRIISEDLVKLSFSNIKVSLIPPSTELRGVDLEMPDFEGNKISLRAERLGAGFSLLSFLSSEINISELYIKNGDIQVFSKMEDEEQEAKEQFEIENFIYDKLPLLIDSIHDSLPIQIDGLSLEDVGVVYNDASLEIQTLSLELFENFLIGDLIVTQLEGMSTFSNFPSLLQDIDSLALSFEQSKYDLNIRSLEVWKKLENIKASGQIFFDKKTFSFKSEADLAIENYSTFIESSIGEWMNGYASLRANFNGSERTIVTGEVNVDLNDFKSDFVFVDKGQIRIDIKDNRAELSLFEAQRKSGSVALVKNAQLFDLTSGKILLKNMKLSLKNLATNDALYVIRDDFERVKGYLSGTIDVSFDESFRNINFKTDSIFEIKDFSLLDDSDDEIIGNSFVTLENTELFLENLKKVNLKAEILFGEKSKITAAGYVGDGSLEIKTSEAFVDMLEFGPIAGVKIGGTGNWDFKISGPLDDVVFDVEAVVSQFSIIDLNISRAKAKLKFNLNKLNIELHEFSGSFGQDKISAKGFFDFSSRDYYDIDLSVNDFKYSDLEKAFPLIYNLLPAHPKGLEANLSTKGRVWGTFKTEQTNTNARLSANSITHPYETFERLETLIQFQNEKFELKDFNLVKGAGGLKGSLALDLATSFLEYDAVWSDTPLRQFTMYNMFNLGLDGTLSADLYGSGQLEDLSTRTQINIKNSKVESTLVTDSSITIYNSKSDLFLTGDLMGVIDVDAFINLKSSDSAKPSYVNIDIQSEDLRLPLSFISKHNIYDGNLIGEIDLSFKTSFTIANIQKLDATLDFNKFELSKDGLTLQLDEKKSIKAINGIISPARVPFSGTADSHFIIDVEGELNNRLGFSGDFNLPVVYLDLFTEIVQV